MLRDAYKENVDKMETGSIFLGVKHYPDPYIMP